MNIRLLFSLAVIALPGVALAQIFDPVSDFKIGLAIPAGDKILKWECDVNGDGKNETLLSLKSDYDKASENRDPAGWVLYVGGEAGAYSKTEGVETEPETIDSILPDIDPEACFVGQITELGKRGIVTMRIDNPREGESIGKIYAYTIEGDHLKRTELAQYVILQGPDALFTKYLADDKRTHVQLQELAP